MTPYKRVQALSISAILGAAMLSACGGGSGGGGGGEGVEYGASMEEYQAAFENVDEITLAAQTIGAKGAPDNQKEEDYYAAVTEWSGGKIKFDINYSGSVAAAPEVDTALSSGLLDIAGTAPSYRADVYKTHNALALVSYVLEQDPTVGALQAQAWWHEMSHDLDSFDEEFESEGVHFVTTHISGPLSFQCSEPVVSADDFSGKVMRGPEPKTARMLEAADASAANLPSADAYEALQRGVVDCDATALRVSEATGALAVAPHVTSASVGTTSAGIAMSQSRWESLPLVAQQLLYDRQDVYIESNIVNGWDAQAKSVQTVEENGGSFAVVDDEVEAKFQEVRDEIGREVSDLDFLDVDLSKAAEEVASKWQEIITTDLGIEAVELGDFGAWHDSTTPDLKPYVEALFEEVFLEGRPQ